MIKIVKPKIYVISGEGTGAGHREEYTGTITCRALRQRLTREVCNGDRCAFLSTTLPGEFSERKMYYDEIEKHFN